jgi:hypothetical protein
MIEELAKDLDQYITIKTNLSKYKMLRESIIKCFVRYELIFSEKKVAQI